MGGRLRIDLKPKQSSVYLKAQTLHLLTLRPHESDANADSMTLLQVGSGRLYISNPIRSCVSR